MDTQLKGEQKDKQPKDEQPKDEQSKFEKNKFFTLNSSSIRYCKALGDEIGHVESMIFLQLEFWIATAGKERDGQLWVYESITDIHNAIGIVSESSIKRAVNKLIEKKLLNVGNYNRFKYDRTRWFAINFQEASKLKSLVVYCPVHPEPPKVHPELPKVHNEPPKDHSEPSAGHSEPSEVHGEPHQAHGEPTIPDKSPNTSSENSTKTSSNISSNTSSKSSAHDDIFATNENSEAGVGDDSVNDIENDSNTLQPPDSEPTDTTNFNASQYTTDGQVHPSLNGDAVPRQDAPAVVEDQSAAVNLGHADAAATSIHPVFIKNNENALEFRGLHKSVADAVGMPEDDPVVEVTAHAIGRAGFNPEDVEEFTEACGGAVSSSSFVALLKMYMEDRETMASSV